MAREVYLLLENGEVFEGIGFGAEVDELTAEVVFTTAMTGYLETLTDPSYYGQMVTQTFPLIGNYGVIPSDFESKKSHVSAYIVRDLCEEPSNFRCEGTLDNFLKEQGIPGIYGIDTRYLTQLIREHGVMNGKLTSKKPPYSKEEIEALKDFAIVHAVDSVSRKEPEVFEEEGSKYNVVLWDYGAKTNIIRELVKRGCKVTVVPGSTKAEEIVAMNPDGIMLSNGPGDPAENVGIIEELKKLFNSNIPMFGICLGHQLLALAHGAKTGKLKYGHRGGNQPVKELASNRVFVSSQNHGYAVLSETLPECAELSFINVNDGTCEGVRYHDMPAFTVQFHPEACCGPKDTQFLFDQFIELMESHQK